MMQKGILAVGLMCALMAGPALAGFQFNYTVTSGTGALSGTNIFKFYAKNDQTGEQLNTHLLLGISGTMQSLNGGAFTFDRRDVDGDGLSDANVKGLGISESDITGSFMRIGLYSDWDLGVPEVSILPAKPFTKTGGNPAAFNSTTSWGLDGVNLAANTNPSTLEAAQGLGAFFGAAVVPTGSDVKVSGRLAAEKGGVVIGGAAPLPSDPVGLAVADVSPELSAIAAASNVELGTFIPFSFTATAPEPGTVGVMAVCAIGALARRRSRRR